MSQQVTLHKVQIENSDGNVLIVDMSCRMILMTQSVCLHIVIV